MTELARKLAGMTDTAMRTGKSDLREALLDLADEIGAVFDSDLDTIQIDRQEIRAILSDVHDAAWLIDACHIIRTKLLEKGRNDRFKEFKLPRTKTFDALKEFVDSEVREAAERRPFVYVVWRRSPEAYLYVGKSQNTDGEAARLKLDQRGKLLGALQEATLFSLLRPSPPTNSVAHDVEAAVLNVLKECEAFPEFNDRCEAVPGSMGTEHLSKIGQLLIDLGGRFKPQAEPMTMIVR